MDSTYYSSRSGSYELFRCFADIEADIYRTNNDGLNCLYIAACYGHLNLCKILIDKYNFNVHMVCKNGWTALHYSARYGNCDLFTYFTDMGADIYGKDNDGWNCLHIAALYGHLNLCKILKEKHNFDVHMACKNGWTALHYSARYGSYILLTYFADMGADIYRKTNDDWNCLHIAALYGHLNLCRILKDKYNFDVHMVSKNGWTALHYSARYGNYDLFTYFIDMGADIYLKSNDGWNFLHIAASHGHMNLCKILIDKHNFHVHMVSKNGWKAIHYSARYGSYDLFTYFADMQDDIYLKTNDGWSCLHIAALNRHLRLCKILSEKHNFKIHVTEKYGWTALHYSARYGSYDIFAYFADVGADIYLKNNDGLNCLHIAALYGHLNLCKILIDKHNFDVHMADKDGLTALHYSARYGSYELITYFADVGADIYLKDNDGWNCLHL